MSQGRVKWYSANLGHGFNLPDDEGAELLVVHEDIVGSGLKSLENNARGVLRGDPRYEGHAGGQRLFGLTLRRNYRATER
jgi:cold shock CspA family protein